MLEPKKTDCIDSFREENYFLSNFYNRPVTYQGLMYLNNEAAFQAQKCMTEEEKQAFCYLSPIKAKRLGRSVTLRSDWEAVKVGIMAEIVQAKFTQHADLADLLCATGDKTLIEGNDWGDCIWGYDVNLKRGENHLGRILMDVRAQLRQERLQQQEESV